MAEPVVLTQADGPVLLITLNRPDAGNAIDGALAAALARAVDELAAREDLRAAVLSGAGGVFCAGLDVASAPAGAPPALATLLRAGAPKPVVAAVEGFAIAAGFELALACDLIVAARGARMGLPEVRRGLVPAGGALLRLPHRLPQHVAAELALTGAPLQAERAHALGLVNRLAEPGAAAAVAHELDAGIAAAAPLAVAASRRILAGALEWPREHVWERHDALARAVLDSADAREGLLAFAQRRAPVWRGR